MKKLLLVYAVSLVVLLVSGCGGGTAFVNVGYDELSQQKNVSKQIEIGTGYELSIYLSSNPSTGFSWSESAVISDKSMIQQTGHEYVPPASSSTPVVGAPGTERWIFKTNNKGTSTIKMEYRRPASSGNAEWTFTLTVVVK